MHCLANEWATTMPEAAAALRDALAMEAAESATHALVSHSFGNAPEILLVTDHGEVRLVRGC